MRIDLVGTTADFRRFGPPRPLPLNYLLGENRAIPGQIGEVRLGSWEYVTSNVWSGRAPPTPEPSAICGSRRRSSTRCSTKRINHSWSKPHRRTRQCWRPIPSSLACCRTRPRALPMHHADRVSAGTHTEPEQIFPRRTRSTPQQSHAGRSGRPVLRCRAGAAGLVKNRRAAMEILAVFLPCYAVHSHRRVPL